VRNAYESAAVTELLERYHKKFSESLDLSESIVKLHQIQLDNTLRDFRDSLLGLKPVLENLREPFILQAVPLATVEVQRRNCKRPTETQTETKVPTIAKERQVPAAKLLVLIGSGGRDRTADLGVMNRP